MKEHYALGVVKESIMIGGWATPRAEEVFDLSQDVVQRPRWDPFVSGIRMLDGAQRVEVGVRVWVRSRRGIEMTAEYTVVDRPRVVALKMVRGEGRRDASRVFERFEGEWTFEETSRQLAATMRYTFTLRRGWRWAGPMVEYVFARDVRARVRAMKDAVEVLGLYGAR